LKPATVEIPGVLGRTLRIVIGALQIWFLIQVLPYFDDYVNTQPNASWIPYAIAIAFAFYAFPLVVNLGFRVQWGEKFRLGYFVVIAAAIVFDLFAYGNIWGPPLGLLLYILGVYVHAHLGVAHVIAGLIGTPGCEMRTYAHLSTILLKKEPTEAAICPGLWTPFDKWEAGIKANR
jgi:hypothetical protein